eukprot:TRINITY_DN4640_c0_g1_i12.p1 TRINITY_DN4640_c0_g1~~TRINITY_DN4640_c0_g1_i12.p1  ORF type:complete len:348 (-),score=57.06 TRINITY_DN4640_c0_g1_i12:154-1197(-)
MSWGDIIEKSLRVISFLDLAGHARYFKTTTFAMSGQMPDYSFLVIDACTGVSGTTIDHYELSRDLKIPVAIVITHIDEATQEQLNNTLNGIVTGCNVDQESILTVLNESDLLYCFQKIGDSYESQFSPIFYVSCVTGQGLELLKSFLWGVPPRIMWPNKHEPAEVVIDKTYEISNIGTVVAGTVISGIIEPNMTLLLGPNPEGSFIPVVITSIHSKRVPVNQLSCGYCGSFALQKVSRTYIRKGMVLVAPEVNPVATWTFQANVVSNSIRINFEPVVQSRTVRQSAKIWHVQSTNLVSSLGAESNLVCFRFKYQPEYLKPGLRVVIREGRTKGIGTITQVNPKQDQV